ncbi:hypothetical protein KFL_007160030 [Klebsormidium nitens]|uniref:Uncharacterized protein n=1 Tax=Klebsormidium nitens TaxID=105231 RepID=A0A1Y1ILL2_KLENI|nr:hypothetical protein KFL_007160030 [Klebsormidium nitens]|eukprot:GAQ91032.1 hypothetical protein KFL_007160030 [Klebsormidium nitens]
MEGGAPNVLIVDSTLESSRHWHEGENLLGKGAIVRTIGCVGQVSALGPVNGLSARVVQVPAAIPPFQPRANYSMPGNLEPSHFYLDFGLVHTLYHSDAWIRPNVSKGGTFCFQRRDLVGCWKCKGLPMRKFEQNKQRCEGKRKAEQRERDESSIQPRKQRARTRVEEEDLPVDMRLLSLRKLAPGCWLVPDSSKRELTYQSTSGKPRNIPRLVYLDNCGTIRCSHCSGHRSAVQCEHTRSVTKHLQTRLKQAGCTNAAASFLDIEECFDEYCTELEVLRVVQPQTDGCIYLDKRRNLQKESPDFATSFLGPKIEFVCGAGGGQRAV